MKKIQENTIWKTWKKKIPKKYSRYVERWLKQDDKGAIKRITVWLEKGQMLRGGNLPDR